MEQTSDYPKFYRLANRALRRDADTTGVEVIVPLPGSYMPTIHGPVTHPSKERFDEEVNKMEPCDKDTYESYLFTCFQAMDQKRAMINNAKQKRYVDAKGLS